MARIGGFDIYEGTYFKAMDRTGNSSLASNPHDEESIENIRKFIDKRNEWARYTGNKEETFCIVRIVWNKIYFPDGTFRESSEKKTMVELYPQEN